MPTNPRQLVIKLTTGTESPERLSQAFTVAVTALASGARLDVPSPDGTFAGGAGRRNDVSIGHHRDH